ncbi:MAG: methyltransferase [Methanobacterium sp.]|uniref:class I SAM-dependent methyltransferase n=1 Tax=Methanobacterium sp. TaxID=2164 RepID=UPI003C71E3A7
MKQNSKERFHSESMASSYDEMCQLMVPGYNFMQDTLIDKIKFENIGKITLLDLGAGSGIFIERILDEFPDSTCIYLDYSEEFINIASNRLSKYIDRVTYIKSDICDDWELKLESTPNIITSSSAIHHLLNEDKKKLYNKCYDVLEDNGWFFNIDEMKTVYNDAYLQSLHYWIYHTEKLKEIIPKNLNTEYEMVMEKFDDWKKRNVDHINSPKVEGDDIHESFLVQLEWLKEAGFKETDVFCKLYLWSMIGGKKIIKDP